MSYGVMSSVCVTVSLDKSLYHWVWLVTRASRSPYPRVLSGATSLSSVWTAGAGLLCTTAWIPTFWRASLGLACFCNKISFGLKRFCVVNKLLSNRSLDYLVKKDFIFSLYKDYYLLSIGKKNYFFRFNFRSRCRSRATSCRPRPSGRRRGRWRRGGCASTS